MTDSKIKVIFVPGIRPKPPAREHEAQLRRCLRSGLERAGAAEKQISEITESFTLVGWSHGFYGRHGDIAADMPGIERLITGQDTEASTLHEARSLGRRFIGFCYGLADRFPILGTRFSTRQMRSRVAELRRYFDDENSESTKAREHLKSVIRSAWAKDQRVLVVGHSFGSVIAYDALWQLSREGVTEKVDVFLTMGSPMTMSFIRGHLLGSSLSGADRYPDCIRRWVNVAAIGEVTTLGRKMADCFRLMLREGYVESIDDDLTLVNRFHGPNGLNAHKCYGYFASRHVAELLLNWTSRTN